ncbi:hypothetical protein ACJ2A9_19510 [Anaerobacillus sp. MEB173]|uniref:hypothetical protein n=1 Tax=Anaerobacillus sp. MEB173 TaxID=3383345 RepID=UPI003F8DAC4F
MDSKICQCDLCGSEVVCEEVLEDFFVCFKCQKDSYVESLPEGRTPYSKKQIHRLMKERNLSYGIVDINNNILEIKLTEDDVILTGTVYINKLTTVAGDREDYEDYVWVEEETEIEPFIRLFENQKHIFYQDFEDYIEF